MNQEQMVKHLKATGCYRVIRKYEPRDRYSNPDASRKKKVMVVDVETTGLDPEQDKIIDLGFVRANFDPETGKLYDVIERYSGFEDPGIPIPDEVTRLTGITDADVAGARLDDERIKSALADSHFVIAHNAAFDRNMIERRFPEAASRWWGCSMSEGPWDALMTGSRKLEWLMYQLGEMFYEAHRAQADAEVTLHLLSLSVTLPEAEPAPVLKYVVSESRRTTYRIWALGAPFETKDVLRSMKYRWSPNPSNTMLKAWYLDTKDLDGALLALKERVFLGKPKTIMVDEIRGRERFTERIASRKEMSI